MAVATEANRDLLNKVTEMKLITVSIEYTQPPIGVPKVAVNPTPAATANIYFLNVLLIYSRLNIYSLERELARHTLKCTNGPTLPTMNPLAMANTRASILIN